MNNIANITILKTFARYVQSKTWDNKSLSLTWIRSLAKMMQLSREMLRYINDIRYQGDDLKIDYEWSRIVYYDVDPYTTAYKLNYLRHYPKVDGYLGQYFDVVRSRRHWQDRRLPNMPRLSQH